MLLRLSTTHRPATDLGYLLHKNPARPQSFDLTFGTAHVWYPEADEARTTVALLLEVDPVRLSRGPAGGRATPESALEPYVNDRPYAASSFLAVALAEVFGSALNGTSRERPELAATAIPLEARLPALPCRGGEALLRRLFEPLGYAVDAARLPLDRAFPSWGESPYFSVALRGTVRLADLLSHLYVLVPVLDDDKHYWVGDAEVEKLLRRGEGWLAGHPARDEIVRRYLRHRRSLARLALARLLELEEQEEAAVETRAVRHDEQEAALEGRLSLAEQRAGAVVAVLRSAGARRVADLGCGEGRLLRTLLADREFDRVVGVDASHRSLEIASERLGLDRMPPRQRERVDLLHGALTYRDRRLAGFDAATLVEVVEHLDPPRLGALERSVFEFARPRVVVVTTPNVEWNVRFDLAPGRFRHRDHRFEWTRGEFRAWAERVASTHSYGVRFLAVGSEDAALGPPTQMAVFTLGLDPALPAAAAPEPAAAEPPA